MEDVLNLYQQPASPSRVRLCFDERPCQLLDEVIQALPMEPGKAAREDNEYVRQGTAVVLLAYDLDSGQRYTQIRHQRTKADYAQFMHHLLTTYYPHVELIDVVQDNLNTHKYGSFYEHLPLVDARNLSRKLVFHYTPKHGSWLNMAEVEFSALARQCLNRRIGSIEELGQQIDLWVTDRNQRATKIHWSFTVATAEDKLRTWYGKVNPANKSDCCKN